MKPFTRNRFHYNWHWIWDTGNGDIGNQAIHEIDIARWGLGVRFPVSVSAMGGHFMFDDDQETPNTLNATFVFDDPQGKRKMMELEVRHWITNHEAEIGTDAYGASGIPGCRPDQKARRQTDPGAEGRQDQHHRQHLLRIEWLPRHRRIRCLQDLAHRSGRTRAIRQSCRRPLGEFH